MLQLNKSMKAYEWELVYLKIKCNFSIMSVFFSINSDIRKKRAEQKDFR